MRARVDSMNAASEPIRIGSGNTIEASPASQQPRTMVINSRLVGPSTATWSPGTRPFACSAAPTTRASSWIWSHPTYTGSPSGMTECPTKRTPAPESAPASSRAIVESSIDATLVTSTAGAECDVSRWALLAPVESVGQVVGPTAADPDLGRFALPAPVLEVDSLDGHLRAA